MSDLKTNLKDTIAMLPDAEAAEAIGHAHDMVKNINAAAAALENLTVPSDLRQVASAIEQMAMLLETYQHAVKELHGIILSQHEFIEAMTAEIGASHD